MSKNTLETIHVLLLNISVMNDCQIVIVNE